MNLLVCFNAGPINGKLNPKPTSAPTGFFTILNIAFGTLLKKFFPALAIFFLNCSVFTLINLKTALIGATTNPLNAIRRIVPASVPTNPIIFVNPTVSATAIPVINARFPKNLTLKSFKASTLPSDFNLKNVSVWSTNQPPASIRRKLLNLLKIP